MTAINKEHVEQMLDLLDGTRKLSEADLRSFVYDMRMAILKDQWDADSFNGAEYNELKKRIEELEDENDSLQEEIDDLR